MSVDFVRGNFNSLWKDVTILDKYSTPVSSVVRLESDSSQLTLLKLENKEFYSHPVQRENFSSSKYLQRILARLCSDKPSSYERLLATEGVGPKTMRALALVAEVIYGAALSYRDPARYSFAHGGKDATPYPVDRLTYDKTIGLLREYVNKSQMSSYDKNRVMRRLGTAKIN
jgi:hypothetical protein